MSTFALHVIVTYAMVLSRQVQKATKQRAGQEVYDDGARVEIHRYCSANKASPPKEKQLTLLTRQTCGCSPDTLVKVKVNVDNKQQLG